MSLQGLPVRKVRVEAVNIEAGQGKARISGRYWWDHGLGTPDLGADLGADRWSMVPETQR